ncbi:MAG: glucose 1-dehydrogenase [Betaproteobacteria bacterium]|nr:glucose 1-dehydrogenase [Betaproteobacteria bacterium]
MTTLDFAGKVVAVTGAGQGNGAAIARGFANAGASVAVIDRNIATARSMAEEIRRNGGRAEAFEVDVSDPDACASFASALQKTHGPLDVLVNNAGVLIRAKMTEPEAHSNWAKTLSVNLDGPYNMTSAFVEQLKASKGCILNLCSIQSFVATPNSVAYTASKGGVAQLTKALASELAEFGIRVNAIAPGVIATPMTTATLSDPAKIGALLSHVPMRRYAQPEELAGPAMFLCSPLASYITGVILPVDGGYLAV